MLTSRVLFLSTYDTKLDFDDLFHNHGLAESINKVRIYAMKIKQPLTRSRTLLATPKATPKAVPRLLPLQYKRKRCLRV